MKTNTLSARLATLVSLVALASFTAACGQASTEDRFSDERRGGRRSSSGGAVDGSLPANDDPASGNLPPPAGSTPPPPPGSSAPPPPSSSPPPPPSSPPPSSPPPAAAPTCATVAVDFCDFGTTCADDTDGPVCLSNWRFVVDREMPLFDCTGATHFQIEMTTTDALVIKDDHSTVEGTVNIGAGDHLTFQVDGEVSGTSTNELIGSDMLLRFTVAGETCTALAYELNDAINATYTSATFFDDVEPGIYIDTWSIVLLPYGQMGAREQMEFEAFGSTDITDHYGVYCIDNGYIRAAFIDPDTTYLFEGTIDEDHMITKAGGDIMIASL